MTPAELKSARHALGLSAEGFARLVRVESGRTIRRWEAGERDIPGPVTLVVELLQESAEARRHCGVGAVRIATPAGPVRRPKGAA